MEKRQKLRFDVENFRAERAEGQELPDLVGHAAIFDREIDMYWFTESIAPGAFAAAIARGDDVRALVNHDPNLIIARSPKTLQLSEDSAGLLVRISPAPTSAGRDIVTSIERGDISQMSFQFEIEHEEVFDDQSREKPHFYIRQVKLYDVAPVTFPAYPQTDISVARSTDDPKYADFLQRIARAKGRSKDEIAEIMLGIRSRMLELERLRVHS